MNRLINRRTVLRGAGVALTLPWLESLVPRAAGAAASAYPQRFLPVFFPNGSAEFWQPAVAGAGDAWSLSPILQPFQALKAKMIVITNMENYTPFKVLSGVATLNPSHGQCPGAFLACVDANVVRAQLNVQQANGISADQVLAQSANYATATAKNSMQVGLSTVYSYCDGKDCSVSRSISWSSATEPTYKDVDPGTIFDEIVGATNKAAPTGMPDPAAAQRRALGKSVLDAVLENATNTRARLGKADQMKLDEFLASVRTVETNVTSTSTAMTSANCVIGTRPTMAATPSGIPDNVPGGYSKETHANLMNDLIVMAFQCDVTRVISYMLEDERSEFIYSHVPLRLFTTAGSTPSTDASQVCGNYHGAQHASPTDNGFATINWWQSSKIADLATRLDMLQDGPGVSVLDNTVIMYAAAMHGGNHQSNQLPVALIGGGGGSLKLNQHVMYGATPGDRPMRDLYYTLLNKTYGLSLPSFGTHTAGIPNSYMTEIING